MILLYNNKVPRNRVIELELPAMRFEGWLTVQLGRNLDGKNGPPIILRELKFRNLIVDAGLDRLGGNSLASNTNYLGVGTGSVAPTAADTGLGTELGRTNSNGGFVDTFADGPADAYHSRTLTKLFLEAQVNGNLTECGFFVNAAGAPMWMRQLFKDGGGVPTTIVKTSSDQLKIIYELRVYPPSVDVTSTITISGTSYTYVHRAAMIGDDVWRLNNSAQNLWSDFGSLSWNNTGVAYETNTLGATSGQPTGTKTKASTISASAYVNGNFFRDITEKWEPAISNYPTGIGATGIVLGSNNGSTPNFQTSWTPKFTKDNTKRLTLVTRISWANH